MSRAVQEEVWQPCFNTGRRIAIYCPCPSVPRRLIGRPHTCSFNPTIRRHQNAHCCLATLGHCQPYVITQIHFDDRSISPISLDLAEAWRGRLSLVHRSRPRYCIRSPRHILRLKLFPCHPYCKDSRLRRLLSLQFRPKVSWRDFGSSRDSQSMAGRLRLASMTRKQQHWADSPRNFLACCHHYISTGPFTSDLDWSLNSQALFRAVDPDRQGRPSRGYTTLETSLPFLNVLYPSIRFWKLLERDRSFYTVQGASTQFQKV